MSSADFTTESTEETQSYTENLFMSNWEGFLVLWVNSRSFAGKNLLHCNLCLRKIPDTSIQLHLVNRAREFTYARPGLQAHLQQVASQQDRRRRPFLDFQLARARDEPILGGGVIPILARHPISVATQRVGFGHTVQQIQFALARQTAKRPVADFITLLIVFARLEMIAHQRQHLRAHVVTVERVNIKFIEKA